MAKKEMTVEESINMTTRPYKNKFNLVNYGPEALSKVKFSNNEGFTYTGEGADENKAGAGRGKQGGPTVKELKDFESKAVESKAKGGSVGSASRRADGCCTKGKTRGKMV